LDGLFVGGLHPDRTPHEPDSILLRFVSAVAFVAFVLWEVFGFGFWASIAAAFVPGFVVAGGVALIRSRISDASEPNTAQAAETVRKLAAETEATQAQLAEDIRRHRARALSADASEPNTAQAAESVRKLAAETEATQAQLAEDIRRHRARALSADAEAKRAQAAENIRKLAAEAEATQAQQFIRAHFDAHPQHVRVLKQIWDRTVYKDDFGDYQYGDWYIKRDHYIRDKMKVAPGDEDSVFKQEVTKQLILLWNAPDFSSIPIPQTAVKRDGTGFEELCLRLLLAQGFQVRSTPVTGDHGADLLARKGHYGLAIQCKDHAQPIGNHAVMEVESARQFYDCTNAVVVSNSGFTKSARQLANKLGISLMDSDQLQHLRKEIQRAPTKAAANIQEADVDDQGN
jgi:restriction system protein